MLALRYIALLALIVWIGGLLVLGAIAAPVTFAVIDARHVADGRLLAGAIFGGMLRQFAWVSYGAGVLILATLFGRKLLGPRPRRFNLRAGLAAVMLAFAAYAGLVVTPQIEQLQREMQVAPSSLPDTDARRIAFGRLHGLASTLQLVPLLGGLMLVYWELKE